jgi:hypothetical protein
MRDSPRGDGLRSARSRLRRQSDEAVADGDGGGFGAVGDA